MSFVRTILSIVTWIQYKQFVKSCKEPELSQQKCWNQAYQVLKSRKTVKRRLKDNSISEIEDYLDQLNVDNQTRTNPYSGDQILFWAQSAGTTGSKKIFPLTRSYQKQFQHSIPPFLYQLIKKYKNFLKKSVLYLAAVDPVEQAASGIPIGYISNYNYHNMPNFIKRAYALPDEVLSTPENYAMMAPLYAMREDLSSIIAVTPLSIEKFTQRLIDRWESFLERLEKREIPISNKRLAYLQSLDVSTLTLQRIWPSMEFICCWKSSVCKNQLDNMEKIIGTLDVVDAIYSATEGWINVPLINLEYGGAVHPGTHNLEFLEVGCEVVKENLIDLWELEVGKEYEVFITNNMGLVRYRIKDIVKCTGYFERSPIIHFVRKASSQLSLGLVTVSENELVEVCEKLNLPLDEDHYFTPNQSFDGLLYCYSEKAPTDALIEELDILLRNININYNTYVAANTIKKIQALKIEKAQREFHAQTKPKYLYQEYLG